MRFSFDFIVRMAGSKVIEANDLAEAKDKLEKFITSAGGHELVDFEVIKTSSRPLAAMTDLEDLKKVIKSL